MPHILRGVSLLGISSANCPLPWRQIIWSRLALAMNPLALEKIFNKEIDLSQLPEWSAKMLERKTQGRILVKI